MPDSSKKRIKPVIEEIVDTPVEKVVETTEEPQVTPQVEATETVETVASEPAKVKQVNEKRMNLKLIVVITLVSALVAAVVSGGVYVYLSGISTPSDEQVGQSEATATPQATVTPSATPEPEIDVSTLSVQVLNGSGAIGAASGGEEVLQEAGFTVTKTGNAGKYDYENTVIQSKSGISAAVVAKVKKALEDGDYSVEIGSALAASSEYDIVVIVGAN